MLEAIDTLLNKDTALISQFRYLPDEQLYVQVKDPPGRSRCVLLKELRYKPLVPSISENTMHRHAASCGDRPRLNWCCVEGCQAGGSELHCPLQENAMPRGYLFCNDHAVRGRTLSVHGCPNPHDGCDASRWGYVLTGDPSKAEQFRREVREYLLLDCVATTNLVGPTSCEGTQASLLEANVNPAYIIHFDGEDCTEFRFGNDGVGSSDGVLSFQAYLLGKPVVYSTHVSEGQTPWLSSVNFMGKIGSTWDGRQPTRGRGHA